MRLLLTLLLAIASAAAQQISTAFVSPNVRDTMTYVEARSSLGSFEQKNFIAVADRVLCALSPRPAVDSAIGEVHETSHLGLEGAENSTVLRAPLSFEEMRYAVALLGRYAHQEYVIVFAPQPDTSSTSRLFSVTLPKPTARRDLERVLDSSRVRHRTLLGDKTVLVFLPSGVSDAPVRNAARRLHASVRTESGVGEIIGDDDRLRAAAIYDRIIADYESAHPDRKLSSKLWTAEWHDAISRTCTTASFNEAP